MHRHSVGLAANTARRGCPAFGKGTQGLLLHGEQSMQMSILANLDRAKQTTGRIVATVFGCTGQLGRYVVNRLARVGAQVVVPYRAEEKAINHLKPMGDVGQIIPLPFSISDKASVERAVEHSTLVVNLIGRHYASRNYSFEETNIESARVIAEASRKIGADRLIHLSCNGADASSPSIFAKTKAESERVVRDNFPSATIIRTTTIAGPEDRFLNRWGFLPKFTNIIPLIIPGETRIQPLFVRDFATAFAIIASDPATAGKTFSLGGPKIYTIRNFLNDIVLPYTKRHATLVDLPPSVARLMAKGLQVARNPLFVADEVDYFSRDDVVSDDVPAANRIEALVKQLTPIELPAVNLLRQFRPPVRFDADLSEKY